MEKIKLKTYTGENVECIFQAALMSKIIKSMIENIGYDKEMKPIPLLNDALSTPIVIKIVEWLEYHYDDILIDDDFDKELNECKCELEHWDKKFIDVERIVLYDILAGAVYLDIKGLIDVACKKICSLIKGKSCEEAREILNITNDFTKEEEEQNKKEREWLKDTQKN